MERTYQVTGMSCGHCKVAVESEVGQIDGVEQVAVDVATGAVTVTATGEVDDAAVRAAVSEAGYEVTA